MSVYCGGLWLVVFEVVIVIGKVLIEYFREIFYYLFKGFYFEVDKNFVDVINN